MKLKPGYKQTEVGVIPEEWRDCDISDLCQFQRGFDLTEATRKSGDVPVYSSSGLSYFHNEVRLKPPAVITGRKGMLGKVFFVDEPCWPHDTTLWVKDFKGNHPQFVALFLGEFRLERFDAATSVPTLNRNNVVGVPIILPPLPEQRAIAAALSEVDALLAALDRLLAKKRDLKQAAMQQLLTGQTRLPGFEGEWETVRLGELFSFKNGLNKAKQFFGFGSPIVNYMDVFGSPAMLAANLAGKVSLLPTEIRNFDVRKGDVFFTRTSETPEEIGTAAVMLDEPNNTVFSGFVLRARPRDTKLDDNFKAYCFRSQSVRQQIVAGASYTTRALTNGRLLSAVGLGLPPKPEQTAIAAVLSDMDAELAALEQRREKTRALKQGMMQELLTGRTRLV